MFRIYYLNPISPEGTALWKPEYRTAEKLSEADAVLVRSAAMEGLHLPEQVLAVARAGAGVNNIPLRRCAEQGIVVFNTPGANASSVMELALCGMLLGSRDVIGGIEWTRSIRDSGSVAAQVEKGKRRFAGHEIAGRRLGVIGLGAVGGLLANAAWRLGMEVYGYDPYISIDAAWHLDNHIHRVQTLDAILEACDVISLHTPLLEATRHMINAETLGKMRSGVLVLNFARDQLVDDEAMAAALQSGRVRRYVTDFPNNRTANMEGVIAIPHLGASTQESEDKCARMAVRQVMDYLENGNITHSVNFPDCDMGSCLRAGRMAILHRNIPNSLSRFTAAVSGEGVNIAELLNRSRGEYAYTMLDLDSPAPAGIEDTLKRMEGVLRVRCIQ